MRALLAAAALELFATGASAHTTEDVGGGLASGFMHPILGPSHLIAMVGVGLWGAQLGMPLLVTLPLAFPLLMAVGATLGVIDTGLPLVEPVIAMSAIALGLAVALAWRAPVPIAVGLVSVFAIFHGYAHGQVLPAAASAIAYGSGFMIGTGLLHLAGIGIGLLNGWQGLGTWQGPGPMIVRGAGLVIAVLGLWFLIGTVGMA